MDRITKKLLDEFSVEHSLTGLSEAEAFERFASYLVTATHYTETFPPDSVATGTGETGIDGLAVLVNGSLVDDPEEVADLAQTNGFIDATFIFVQAETSSGFDMQKAGHFGFAVQDFFSESPQLRQNSTIQLKRRIVDEILDHSSRFRKGNPRCFLYYATTGMWTDDHNLNTRKEAVKRDLETLGLFRSLEFEYLGADELQKLYRNSQNAVTAEVTFVQKTALPELPRVNQAYLGFIPISEFLKLVQTSSEEVLTSIFYDNVRHWQEWNTVNNEMRETLEDSNTQAYFPLLNNGVTVVTQELTSTGNKMVLDDYQIVNGCQTSFVLHETRDSLDSDVLVPLRLIETKDADVRNLIIKATNRQTPVTDEQLFALAEFPRKLEEYFSTFDGNHRLYYERRSRQYAGVQDIEKVRVITMTMLVRAFASVFLELPHRTTRNYKALLRSVGTDIFGADHELAMYYVAAYAHYRLDYLFRSQFLEPELKPARYHLLTAFRRMSLNDNSMPRFNSREMKSQCEELMKVLWSETTYKDKFSEAADLVRSIANGNYHRDNIRTEPFTKLLLQKT